MSKNIQDQVEQSLRGTDIILFMLDSRAGITALDNSFAKWLRIKAGQFDEMSKSNGQSYETMGPQNNRKVIVLANKSEGAHLSDVVLDSVADASRLGFGLPIPISASHGDGLADLAVLLLEEAETRNCYLDGNEERKAIDEARLVKLNSGSSGFGLATEADGALPNLRVEDRMIQLAFMGRPNVGKYSDECYCG